MDQLNDQNPKVITFQNQVHFCFTKLVTRGRLSKIAENGEFLKLNQKTKNNLHLKLIWLKTKIEVLASMQLILEISVFPSKFPIILTPFCISAPKLSWTLKIPFLITFCIPKSIVKAILKSEKCPFLDLKVLSGKNS